MRLRFTGNDLLEFDVVDDDVIDEPLGGAHRDHLRMSAIIKGYLKKTISTSLQKLPIDQLIEQRYERFRKLGQVH